MTGLAELTADCGARLKAGQVITEPAQLRTYECDGLSSYRSTPGLVVLAESAEEIAYVVGRGSGTGLSGGALPRTDGGLIVAARLNRIVALSADDERAVVEPGVINASLTAAAVFH